MEKEKEILKNAIECANTLNEILESGVKNDRGYIMVAAENLAGIDSTESNVLVSAAGTEKSIAHLAKLLVADEKIRPFLKKALVVEAMKDIFKGLANAEEEKEEEESLHTLDDILNELKNKSKN